MRELKFRVWEEREKAYNTWSYILDTIGNIFRNAYGALIGCDKKDYIVEQYTGLKDNDGKEIYEGDVVWWEHYNGMNGKICEHKAEVYYDEKLGGYFVSYADTSLSELIMEEEVYINTNIHENKELLDE